MFSVGTWNVKHEVIDVKRRRLWSKRQPVPQKHTWVWKQQVGNEEDRTRHQQRWNRFMSNPNANLSSGKPSDLASKVEMQRFEQELTSAEGALAIVQFQPMDGKGDE